MNNNLYSPEIRKKLHNTLSADEIAVLRSNLMKIIETTESSYNELVSTYDFICYHHTLGQAYLEYAYYTTEEDLIEEYIKKAEHSIKAEKSISEFQQQIADYCYNVCYSPDELNKTSNIVLDNDVSLNIDNGDDNITVSDVSEPLYSIDSTKHTPYFDFVSTQDIDLDIEHNVSDSDKKAIRGSDKVYWGSDLELRDKNIDGLFNPSDNAPDIKLNIKQDQDKIKEYNFTDHPTHYNIYDYEVIDMMEKIWGTEDAIKWCKMTAWKYRQRMGTKPGEPIERDLEKERWYLNKADELKKKLDFSRVTTK